MKIDQIPGVKEAGWRPEGAGIKKTGVLTEAQDKALTNVLRQLLRELKNSEHSWPFLDPVSREEVPDYYNIIKDPGRLIVLRARCRDEC